MAARVMANRILSMNATLRTLLTGVKIAANPAPGADR
jgi:hypothetical protein